MPPRITLLQDEKWTFYHQPVDFAALNKFF